MKNDGVMPFIVALLALATFGEDLATRFPAPSRHKQAATKAEWRSRIKTPHLQQDCLGKAAER
jgi:hypothetical protein